MQRTLRMRDSLGKSPSGTISAEMTDVIRPATMMLPSRDQIAAIAGRTAGEIRSTAMARKLGVHGRTIRRMYERGVLPGAKEHGERILVVPTHLLRLAEAYGLRGVERMARAGLL